MGEIVRNECTTRDCVGEGLGHNDTSFFAFMLKVHSAFVDSDSCVLKALVDFKSCMQAIKDKGEFHRKDEAETVCRE